MKFTEQQIGKMASPISQTEEEKCKNAIRMVRDAMKRLNYTDDGKEIRSYVADTYSYSLDLRQMYSDKKIKLLVQGSYANKTNIASESDVDVAVIFRVDIYFCISKRCYKRSVWFYSGDILCCRIKG